MLAEYTRPTSQHAAPGPSGFTKRGRDQAGGGKASSQGQNADRLLSTAVTETLHRTCHLLLRRDASSNHIFLPYDEQSKAAIAVVRGVVGMEDNSPDSVVKKTLKR